MKCTWQIKNCLLDAKVKSLLEGVPSAGSARLPPSVGHTWLRGAVQVFLQEGHRIDHRGVSGWIHELSG